MKYNDILTLFNKYYSLIPCRFFTTKSFLPRQFIFEITYGCNLKCNICQFLPILNKADEPRRKELSTGEILKCIMKLPSLSLISFTGGEPLSRKDIKDILLESSKIRRIHLITNGFFLDYKTCEYLSSTAADGILFSKGLLGIDISYYGKVENSKIAKNPSTDGLDNIIRAKKEKGKKFPLVNFKMVITEKDLDLIVPFYEYAKDKGVDVCSYLLKTSALNFDRSNMLDNPENVGSLAESPTLKLDENGKKYFKDQLLKLLELSKNSRTQLRLSPSVSIEDFYRLNVGDADFKDFCCYAPWSFAAITAYGDLFPCSNLNLGNLLEHSLEDLWYSDKMREFRIMIREGLLPNCKRCCYLQKR